MNEKLYLYKLSQTINDELDTYDSAVVCAASPDEARVIEVGGKWSWCAPEHVTVRPLGAAIEGMGAGEIICSSYNAG